MTDSRSNPVPEPSGTAGNGVSRSTVPIPPLSIKTGVGTGPGEDWRDLAACKNRPDLDWLFFPRNGLVSDDALELCGGCPVFADCLRFAVDTRQEGIWAATNDDDRREMRGVRPHGRRGSFYTPENVAKRHAARLEAKRQRDRRLAAITALHADGLNDREIGLRLGLPPRHVQTLRSSAGLQSARAAQAVDMGEIRRLNELGYNDVEIAQALGVVPECVRKRRNLMGLPARGRKTVNREFRNGEAAS